MCRMITIDTDTHTPKIPEIFGNHCAGLNYHYGNTSYYYISLF